jgi:hypothetical protein
MQEMKKWPDINLILILLFVVVSTGHVGTLFANRESEQLWWIGYVLALAIDSVLIVTLITMAKVSTKIKKVYALLVFVVASVISAWFNYAYYRSVSALDPIWLSAMLGVAAPGFAALLAVLRAMTEIERVEESEHERERTETREDRKSERENRTALKRFEIAEKEKTKRTELIEKTKQQQLKRIVTTKSKTNKLNGRLRKGELDEIANSIISDNPEIGPRPLMRELEAVSGKKVSPSTAHQMIGRFKGEKENGQS